MIHPKYSVRLALVYATVAVGEIALHGLLILAPFRFLLRIYLMSNLAFGSGNSGMSLITDLIIPACLLGYWNGRLAREAPSPRAGWLAIPLAVGVVALYPIYDALVRVASPVWWWPKSPKEALLLLAVHVTFGAGIILRFTTRMRQGGVRT
jgi:hypothetical protein